MTQTPMTTREAITVALSSMKRDHGWLAGAVERHNIFAAANALCEAYNLKLSDFFDENPAEAE